MKIYIYIYISLRIYSKENAFSIVDAFAIFSDQHLPFLQDYQSTLGAIYNIKMKL